MLVAGAVFDSLTGTSFELVAVSQTKPLLFMTWNFCSFDGVARGLREKNGEIALGTVEIG
jgi:hypothetical protein